MPKALNSPLALRILNGGGQGADMLVQMPRGSSTGGEPPGPTKAECTPFEAALRRDLANAPVVSYESLIGGWPKRAFDLTVTFVAAPIWLLALLVGVIIARVRHKADLFVAEERVGYGGRSFKVLRLRLSPPSAVIEVLRASAPPLTPIAEKAETRAAKWVEALERLPNLFNVLRGEMSLVGPRPLMREEVEMLRTARRYYLSARPGVIGLGNGEADEESVGGPYKVYALSWSIWHDILIAWRAARELRDRGELWRPGLRLRFRDTPRDATDSASRRRNS
jgi:exopolysaccharide production protein ExoY